MGRPFVSPARKAWSLASVGWAEQVTFPRTIAQCPDPRLEGDLNPVLDAIESLQLPQVRSRALEIDAASQSGVQGMSPTVTGSWTCKF